MGDNKDPLKWPLVPIKFLQVSEEDVYGVKLKNKYQILTP